MGGATPTADDFFHHFRTWLRGGLTGCSFASSLAGARLRIASWQVSSVPSEDDLEGIGAFIDRTAARRQIALLMFPRLRTAVDVARTIHALSKDKRWTCKRVEWRNHAREDSVLIGMNWSTPGGLISSAMGFAPLGTMPVTRRAPYVAIALWAGGHENPHFKNETQFVGLPDFPTDFAEDKHKSTWDATRRDVRLLFADPPEDALRLREVAFCLPRAAVEEALSHLL
jgi:hypothetical protein